MKSNVKTDAEERTLSPAGNRVNRDRRASCLVLALLAAASFHLTRQWDQDQILQICRRHVHGCRRVAGAVLDGPARPAA